MGTIAEKLTYLSDTKDKLKDSINNIGGSITNETTFRAYATELDNIYSSLPKTTGEGSNLSLSTIKGRINVDDILGDTSQFTTTGKNKATPRIASGTTPTGLAFKINADGTFEVKGTISTTSATSFSLTEDIDYTNYFNQNMTLSCGYNTTSNIGAITCVLMDNSKTTLVSNVFNIDSGNSTKTANISSTTYPTGKYIKWTFYIPNNKSGTAIDIKGKLQLEVGSSATTFEAYTGGIASPNPTYPQDIEVVTGQQEVVVRGKNFIGISGITFPFTQNGITISREDDGSFTFNGTLTENTYFYLTPYTNNETYESLLPINNQYVTLSYTSTGTGNLRNYGIKRSNGNDIFVAGNNSNTKGIISFTNTDLTFCVRLGLGDTTNNKFENYNVKPLLELGNTITTYQPYYTPQTKTLHLGDIELAKIGTYQDRIYKNSDKWYIEKNIGKRTYASNEIVQVNGLSYTNLTYFSIPKSNDSIDYNNFAVSSALFDKYLIQNVVNWDSTNNIGRISNRANALTYWIGVPLGTNIETYRTQVGEIINYYILATPTYTEITNTTLLNELNELEKMMSYNGQTNINISGNLPMILNVSALKGE